MFGPPGLPHEIAERVNSLVNEFIKSDDAKSLPDLGLQGLGGSSQQLVEQMDSDKRKWSKVVSDDNIKIQK